MISGTAIRYKGNFYTALTANVAGNVAEASTRYGSEDIPMVMAGVASKTADVTGLHSLADSAGHWANSTILTDYMLQNSI